MADYGMNHDVDDRPMEGRSVNQIRRDQGMSEARQAGRVIQRLNILTGAIDELERRTDRLREKLTPALGPSSDKTGGSDDDRAEQSELADRLENLADRIHVQIRQLVDLEDRVEF